VAFWGEKARFSLYFAPWQMPLASFETADDLTGPGAISIGHRRNELNSRPTAIFVHCHR
jgi:hypothetical protein